MGVDPINVGFNIVRTQYAGGKRLGKQMIRALLLVPLLSCLFSSGPVGASEPVKCYRIAWGHSDNGGFGLPAGLAVDLCGGTRDSDETLKCFAKAWTHEKNGGLGLPAGLAVRLCKNNPESSVPSLVP